MFYLLGLFQNPPAVDGFHHLPICQSLKAPRALTSFGVVPNDYNVANFPAVAPSSLVCEYKPEILGI